MATWTLRPTSLELRRNPAEALKRHGAEYEVVLQPEEDSQLAESDPLGVTTGRPISRNLIEDSNQLYVERNLYAHVNSSFSLPLKERNAYGEEHVDLEALTLNPPCFIFIGKPGVGKSTLAVPFAKRMNSVLISPQTIIEYYLLNGLPEGIELASYRDGIVDTLTVLALILCRIFELDVIHRGYVMDGFPIIQATSEVTVEEQMKFIYSLPRRPDYVIILHLQDTDLDNRRRLEKIDPATGLVYTMPQYMASDSEAPTTHLDDFHVLQADILKSQGDIPGIRDSDDGGKDLEARIEADLELRRLDEDILGRLVSRPEDRPEGIREEHEEYKNALPWFQAFVDTFDPRKVLQLSGYELPPAMFKKLMSFLTNFGLTPSPMPIKLIPPRTPKNYDYLLGEDGLDEFGEEAPCVPYPEEKEVEPDWEDAERAVVVRRRVDPRFRWRLTAWKRLCPVALKFGRSVLGKPDLAVGFMDKVYFLSSEGAFAQFQINPRPFLLPSMPTSPIKFYIIGHPLSGKSLLSAELAAYLGAHVIDMKREVRRKFYLVKHNHLFRIRFKAVMEITKEIDKQKFREWKKLERSRRDQLQTYLDKMVTVDAMHPQMERRMSIVDAKLKAMTHAIGDTYSGICQTDDGLLGFSYKEFKEHWRLKRSWPHQKKLELAWKLFHEGKLKYKRDKRMDRLQKYKPFYKDKSEEGGEENGEAGEWIKGQGRDRGDDEDESSDEEELGEMELLGEGGQKSYRSWQRPPKQFRPRSFCKPKTAAEEVELESTLSSVFGPDDELEESIVLRHPNLDFPTDLIIPHPRPSNVTEHDPLVTKLVEERIAEAEKWADSIPPEIYADILVRAIAEVELKYLESNSSGPLSGGWIVENLEPDLEKMKAVLRHPITAPDNIVVLADNSDGRVPLLNNLKRQFVLRRQRTKDEELALQQQQREICNMVPIYGQGDVFLGENDDDRPWPGEGQSPRDRYMTRAQEVIGYQEVCHRGKTESELFQARLPLDTLAEQLELQISNSMNALELRDKLRQMSLRDSLLDVTQREILESWLATFGLLEHPGDGTFQDVPGPPPSSAVNTCQRKCTPKGGQPPPPFPEINFGEKGWTARKLGFEFLAFPRKTVMAAREREAATRGSSPSIEDRGDMAADLEPLLDDLGLDFSVQATHSLERLESPQDLLAEEMDVDVEGKPVYLPSLKGNFLGQIRRFDEFWNALIPILNKELISFSELGLIDDEIVFDKVRSLWRSLESRWIPEASGVSKADLKVEYEEWMEANKIWNFAPDLIPKDPEMMGEEDDESDDEDEEDDGEEDLRRNVHKPEEYRRLVMGRERMRFCGDSRDFCPVTLKNQGMIRKGFPEFAAKYLDRTYFFVDENAREEFLKSPLQYLPQNEEPLKAPCPRICVTGTPGCNQEEVALEMAKKYNVYFINFRQRLHEILKVQTGENVGPGMLPSVNNARGLLGGSTLTGAETEKGASENRVDEVEPSGEVNKLELLGESDESSLKNLGIMEPILMAHCPQTEIRGLEQLTKRNWDEATSLEHGIKNFLQYGTQLSHRILEVLLPMFWEAEPFKSTGFILSGFPNTEEDIDFLNQRNCFPESVFVLESKAKTMHNRLHRKTVDEWFLQHPGERTKMENNLRGKPIQKAYIPLHHRKLTTVEVEKLMNESVPIEESDDDTSLKVKDRLYQDTSVGAMISRNLFQWHRIYSKDLKALKIALNDFRIEWTPIHTDVSPIESKRLFRQLLDNCFTCRRSKFETTYDLSLDEAKVLLDKGYFQLSKFGRMCPVEAHRGNRAVNLWHAPGVIKIPILYRRFIYFLAGAENAKEFRGNPWAYIHSPPQTPVTPLYVIVLGDAQSGKTELCKRLADKLGLQYISAEGAMSEIVQKSFVARMEENPNEHPSATGITPLVLADEVMSYLRSGKQVPQYISYKILDFALMEPRTQFHGAVFDNYPLEDTQLQELLERGIVPALVVNLQMEPSEGHRRAEMLRFNPKYDYRAPLPDSNDFIDYMSEDYEPLIKPCLEWYAEEIQCLMNVDARQSPTAIFHQVRDRCYAVMTKIQRYIYAGLKGLPSPIDGLGPLSSLIHGKLSESFGNFDPVALNDHDELVPVKDLNDLRRVVEYRGELFVFSSEQNVDLFLGHPQSYTLPKCKRIPPKDVPMACTLNEAQMNLLRDSWGFMEFDPVVYSQGSFNSKCLQRGDPKFCVEFIMHSNLT